MPRAAWLAVGAAIAALALGVVPPAAVATAGLAGMVLAVALILVRATPRGFLPLAVGVALLGFRGLATTPAPPLHELPSGDGPWIGAVVSIGALHDGSRPAVIELQLDRPVVVAATLPWYPAVNPGDRVRLGGRIRPQPDDDY